MIKKIILRIPAFAAGAGIVSLAFFGAFAAPSVAAAQTTLQNGADINPASSGDYASASFDQSLQNLAATGANYVTLNVPLYQTNVGTTDVQPDWNAPTPATLATAIQYAHSIGLHVMIKFDVYPGDGQWSAYINPSDRNGWFSNYLATLTPYIQAAQSTGAEEVCIGDELIDMSENQVNSTNNSNWLSLISSIRGMYSGKLTYGANWGGGGVNNEVQNIEFWSALDYIGISAYYNLTGDGSVASLMASWGSVNASDIQPVEAQWNKPILFTEVGYMAIQDSYTHPWMWWETGTPDEAQQANDYQALFEYWDQQSDFAGQMLWEWSSNPNAGGANDDGYTPQGKTAEQTMKQYFTQPAGSSVAPAFQATATVTPSSPSVGQSTAFTVNVDNSGGAASDANVDMEIYNSAGAQVFQKILSGENMGAQSSQSYTFDWTPSSAGAYVLKVGVFNGSWSQEYYWGNQVAPFTVESQTSGGGSGTSTLAAGTIDIWWPTNGANISGVQPFQAMLMNVSVNNYTMYWQVDGGQLNLMATNDTNYPHKQASVDVTPWTWRGNGPYVVTFVAKNSSGQVIATASSTIYN